MERVQAPANPPARDDSDLNQRCARIVQHMLEKGVNFLALDFDLTIIDVHTGGRWPGTPADLRRRIRPLFNLLIPAAISNGVYVAVVTFSPQVPVIAEVLRVAFPDLHSKIPIRGEDGSWEYHGEGSTQGKQPHMASAAEELGQMNADILTRASTLLVDDDPSNISIALEHGVKAVWLNPQKPNEVMKLLEEF